MNKFDIVAVCFILILILILRWYRMEHLMVVAPQQRHRRLAGYDIENDDPVYQDDLTGYMLVPRDLHKLASRLARSVRTITYIRKRSRANDIVIMETIRQEARRINLRRRDLEAVMPLALQLSYLQTRMEHEARLVTTTMEYQVRERETNRRYASPTNLLLQQLHLGGLANFLQELGLLDSSEPVTDQA
jgi:hypothetical protein